MTLSFDRFQCFADISGSNKAIKLLPNIIFIFQIRKDNRLQNRFQISTVVESVNNVATFKYTERICSSEKI